MYKVTSGTVVHVTGESAAGATGSVGVELYVPVSPEGAAVRDQVRLPLMHRRPVGYQREFLEAYQPATLQEARSDVFSYIEMFYNTLRRHSTADGLSPVEFERRHFMRLKTV